MNFLIFLVISSDAYNPTILDTTSKHVLLLPSTTWDQFYDLFIKRYCTGGKAERAVVGFCACAFFVFLFV